MKYNHKKRWTFPTKVAELKKINVLLSKKWLYNILNMS